MNGSSADTSKFLKSLLGDKMHSGLLQPASGVVREKHGTLSNGSRIVLKPKSVATKQREDRIIDEIAAVSGGGGGGGVVDMAALWEKVRVEEAAKVGMEEFEENRDGLEDVARELNGARGKVANTLWTEKYRPRKFIELIGNEKVNASILKWLNEWNYAVKKGKLINNNDYDKESLYNDPLKRPQRKVLLIHGPPGIGKTTIAQCVCKQLGYEMQEINSSDERSGQSVKDRIRNVIKMRSLSGKDVCLLLDEIDGANGSENGFVRSLIYMLNKDARVTDEWNSFGKLKYNKKEDFIRRPIIAMCNDIGSHCLEALKPYCEIVSFKKSNRKSIKKRLKMILEKENVKNVNESLLDDLIISLDGDIRNCINFLQFNSKSLTGKVKDMEIIWFQMIKEIFNIDNVNNKNGGRSKSKSEIFNKLMSKLINSNSDLSKINMGCFNLLLQINEDDDGSSLNKIDELSEWLFFEDMTHSSSKTINKDDIAGYNSILALKFFNLFTNLNDGISTYDKKRTLNFKSSEKFDKRKIISELINNLVKKYEFNLTKNTLISTEMSMLNSIMIPKQLAIKDFEHDKTKIGRVIEIMERMKIGIEVGSIKTNTRMRSGYIRYNKFNPDFVQGLIDKRCENYSGGMFRGGNRNRNDEDGDVDGDDGENNLNEIKAIPYINAINEMYKIEKKLQVDNEKLKRKRIEDSENESGVGMISSSSSGGDKRGISTVEFFKRQYSTFHSQLSKENNNVQEKGESNVGKHADVRSVGAGGSESAGDGSSSSSGVMSDNSNRIWVKYHEGFSNAVRKELTWQTLFKG